MNKQQASLQCGGGMNIQVGDYVECLAQSEFNKVAHQIVKKLKNPCEAKNEC